MYRDRHFVSEEDLFLKQFDKTHPELTESQKQEIKKHQRIALLRQMKQSNTQSK